MFHSRLNIVKTREIRRPTYYVEAINKEYRDFALDEERAETFRGEWREKVFANAPMAIGVTTIKDMPLDLEIGTGHGLFFAHRAHQEPQRLLLGLEIKFKPLIQAIRRALKQGSTNARIARYDARVIGNLFAPGELDHVFIHHPDPWTKRSTHKHRLLQSEFLLRLSQLQRSGSFVDFKTDSGDYFFWAAEQFKNSPYKIERYSEDLHRSEWSDENFTTQFEKFYIDQGQPIYYLRATV